MIFFNSLSNYAQQFGSLLILLLGIFSFFRRDLPIKVLFFYGLNSFVFQQIGDLMVYLKIKAGNNVMGNIYTLIELLILLFFFYTLFNSKTYKRMMVSFAIVYIPLYFIFIQGQWTIFIGSIRSIRDVIMIVCSLMYFYSLLKNMPTVNITQYPMFWIVVGFLLLFAGTFALSLSIDYWIKTLGNDFGWFWTVRNFFRFVCCLVVCYGLWLDFQSVRIKSLQATA